MCSMYTIDPASADRSEGISIEIDQFLIEIGWILWVFDVFWTLLLYLDLSLIQKIRGNFRPYRLAETERSALSGAPHLNNSIFKMSAF